MKQAGSAPRDPVPLGKLLLLGSFPQVRRHPGSKAEQALPRCAAYTVHSEAEGGSEENRRTPAAVFLPFPLTPFLRPGPREAQSPSLKILQPYWPAPVPRPLPSSSLHPENSPVRSLSLVLAKDTFKR